MTDYILTLTCPDKAGIVHAVSGFVVECGGNIIDSAQYGDPETDSFCMRVLFSAAGALPELKEQFTRIAERYGMNWGLHAKDEPLRVLIMVSKFDHCLRDLLYRKDKGDLNIEVPLVVSNHRDAYQLVASHGIPFEHLPVSPETKPQQEARLLELVKQHNIDLVVLARYMQILSSDLCEALSGRVINIHHSFLPGFKGAKPYHQAHSRGVKLIGATAHYATADLDEGPIIEQDVARVTHAQSPEELVSLGREIETRVLSGAVRYQAEHRVNLIGHKTVIFN